MKDELLASLLGTANNVVNKVADDRRRTLEKEEAIAREQEETKRIIAQEEERTRREFVEKGLDKRHRDEIKALQEKRQANPINTVCPSCTGRMEVDRHKGIISCPYCEHTEVLDPIHCYDPILDEPSLTQTEPKKTAPEPQPDPLNMSRPLNTMRASDKAANRGPMRSSDRAVSTAGSAGTSSTGGSLRLKPATSEQRASAMNNESNNNILEKVTTAAKLVDTKPLEGYVRRTARSFILPIISLISGIIAMVTCGVFIVPELIGLLTGLLTLLGNPRKYGRINKVLAGVGFLMSLSATVLVMLSIFILKK